MENLNECSIIFALKNSPGEVTIVGNNEILGNWSPELGIKLIPVGPILITLNPIKLLKCSSIEYKYVTKSNGKLIWETIPNRKLKIKENAYIEDSFDFPISHIDYCQKRFEKLRRNSSEYKLDKLSIDHNKLILISMHLPLSIKKTTEGYKITNRHFLWHAQLFNVAQENFDFLWLGYAGMDVPLEDQEEVTKLLRTHNCIPVFIPEDTLKYHSAYCENILFSVLNNQIDLKSPISSEKNTQQWEGYKILNILFNEALFDVFSGQMIWIHGSELLLLPSFISKKVKDPVNIGFYFHRPFPSSEIFRILPHKNAILNAIGCCDIIGFQIFEHATHFIGTCKRILGVETGTSKDGNVFLNYFGRNINVYIGHIGICPEMIEKTQELSEYQVIKKSLLEKYQGKTIILSIDHISPLSGFYLKFKAIENIVLHKKKFIEKVVFLNILITTSENLKIDPVSSAFIEEINKKAGRAVIELVYKNVNQLERYAYMEVSSGLIVSTVREGMNLLPFEFLQLKKFKNSGIVLSEFAGCSIALSSPYKVNPLNSNSFEQFILQLVNHIPQKDLLKRDLNYIKTKTTKFWASDFVKQMSLSKKKTHKFQYVSIGLNDTLRMMAIPKNFSKLDEFEVQSAYKHSKNRLFLLDVEGTLANYIKQNHSVSNKILNILDDLCNDPKNTVFIISSHERAELNNWFKSIPSLNLAAEHGAYIKYNISEWQENVANCCSWKKLAKTVIKSHVERIEGSSVICKESSVIFDYREADSLFGQWQANDIVSHLERLLNDHECQVIQGEGFVEVKPWGIDKGTALHKIIKNIYKEKGSVDFLFAIGNDESDEKMFKMLKIMKKRSSEFFSADSKTFSCTFGVKPSDALFYVLNADEVVKLIEILASGNNRRRHSLGNLHPKHSNHQFISVDVSSLPRLRRDVDSQDYSNFPLSNYEE